MYVFPYWHKKFEMLIPLTSGEVLMRGYILNTGLSVRMDEKWTPVYSDVWCPLIKTTFYRLHVIPALSSQPIILLARIVCIFTIIKDVLDQWHLRMPYYLWPHVNFMKNYACFWHSVTKTFKLEVSPAYNWWHELLEYIAIYGYIVWKTVY